MQKKYTKNIHLYSVDNKFNINISEIEDDINIVIMPTNYSIYKYFYSNAELTNKDNNLILINSSIINNEILDFIKNFASTLNIWIFLDKKIKDLEIPNVNYISLDKEENKVNYKILSNNIISKTWYDNIINNNNKLDQLVYFFENENPDIHQSIQEKLYPKSNLKIKVFDNSKFNNPQNLGLLTEKDRMEILVDSKYYLHDNNEYYLTEALVCGCIPINIDDTTPIEDQMLKNKNTKPEHITYCVDFIKELYNGS